MGKSSYYLAAIIILLTLVGCKSVEYVPVETVRDHWHTLTQADTLIILDSIVIDRAGDTIRELRWRDRWHITVVHDTVATSDTIREPYPVEVPTPLSLKGQIYLKSWNWLATALVICMVWLLRKPLIAFLKPNKT